MRGTAEVHSRFHVQPVRPVDNSGPRIDACGKAPSGSHLFLHETSDSVSVITCLWCKIPASPLPPDPKDTWSPYE